MGVIIAGPCSWIEPSQEKSIKDTAGALLNLSVNNNLEIWFRCKLWLGGTTPEKFAVGVEEAGLPSLHKIEEIMPTGTEIQTPYQMDYCRGLSYIWVGARSSQNYGLLKYACLFPGNVLVKRHPGMTLDEIIGVYDICEQIYKKKIYIIERGINTFDRKPESRWTPDFKGIIQLKQLRPDIFERTFVDVSHSVSDKAYIPDVYNAFKAIGVENYMVECTIDGKSKTDCGQVMSIDELEGML